MAKHGEEYVRKYEVIEEVMQKLTDNGIRSIVWCFMPSYEHGPTRESAMYFQNLSNFVEYDKGKASKESMLKISYYNHMALLGYLNWFRVYIMPPNHTIIEAYNNLAVMTSNAYNWFTSGKPPENIIKTLDKYE